MAERDGPPHGAPQGAHRPLPLGVILAGGRNRRYGSHKALEEVAGERIVERVRSRLERVVGEAVLIANEPEVYASLGLAQRGDLRTDLGPLGGIHAALTWARELERPGAVVVACDMPFLSSELLERIVARAQAVAGDPPDVVAPRSAGRRGLEPLCAFYGTRCLDAVEASAERGDRRIIGFYDDVVVETLELDEVRSCGDPAVLFMNVNTPDERRRAEAIASRRS